jgi:hypothetical protein
MRALHSCPYALIDSSHVFHLFYDVVRVPGPSRWRQVAFSHARSTEGKHFDEIEGDIITIGGSTWHNWEINGPCVLQAGAQFKMWFAGTGGNSDWTTTGIGYAVSQLVFN